jgi:hypothetical protein
VHPVFEKLLLLLVAGAMFWCLPNALAAIAKAKRAAQAAEFFNEPVLRTFEFQLPEPALSQLRSAPRSYVTGTVTEGTHHLTNVAVRLRGNGSFRSLDERPNFAVKFDEFATNQTYRGLTKLMFNASAQDETYFAEFVARQLFRDAGLPSARVTHSRVHLNGRDLGLYVVIEAITREFLKEHFVSAKGNLYEANFSDIDVRLEQDSGVRGDQADVRRLYRICTLTNAAERWRELPKVLDVDKFVSFAAMEMLTTHWDGYVLHTNNYRLYRDAKRDKFVFIPHGMDWALLRPNLSLQVPQHSAVGRAVFGTPEGQNLYRERVATLFTNVFRVPLMADRIEQELAKIRTGNFSSYDLTDIERRASLMRERVVARAAHASNELAGMAPVPLTFDTNGVAALTEWRADHDGGTGAVDRVTVDGKPTLHIKAAGVYCHPSWRSLVFLPRGSYRYEGTLRIAAPGPVTAMIRLSGPSSATTFGTATDWRTLPYNFQIRDEGNDVEFVCDFSGAEGEAWFDLNSLRVRRLPP